MRLDKPTIQSDSQDVHKERKLSFWQKIYLVEVIKGLWYSLKQMASPTFTIQYPEQKRELSSIFRGRPVLVKENGKERCVACGLCALACPPLAISMQAEEIEGSKERAPKWFEIDMLRCIYCGFCEEVCPEEAIVMSSDYDIVFGSRDSAIFDKQKLLVPKEKLQKRLDWLKKYRNPQQNHQHNYPKNNNIHSLKDL